MHPRQRLSVFACGLVLATSSLAAAQQPPNMIGTWKGVGYGVHIGPTPYRSVDSTGVKFPENGIEFIYVITEQHGNRFAGEMASGKIKETIIGAIQPNNRGGIMLDDDGQYLFTLIDPDTMDACYNHHYAASKLAGCFRLLRSPK